MADLPEPYKTIVICLFGAGGAGGIYKVWLDHQNNKQTAQQKQREGWSTEGKEVYAQLTATITDLRGEVKSLRDEGRQSDKDIDELRKTMFAQEDRHRLEIDSLRDSHEREFRAWESERNMLKGLLRRIAVLLQRKENIPPDLIIEIQAISES